MLAAKADYESGQVIIGTQPGTSLARDQVLTALDEIGYSGQFVKQPPVEP